MKGLIRICALRPVGVTVLYLAVALFGIVALRQLAIDLLPDVDVPRISITTLYEGVAPQEIETLITRPIEQATSTIEGIERIEAVSSEGLSRVQLQFTWGKRLDEALDDVRVAIDRVRSRLPEDAETPSVFKFDLSSIPVAFLGVTGPGDPRRLKYLAQDELSRALERVPGIASVSIQGGRDREIRVALDSSRLAALGISADQVAGALARENRNVSAGDMLDAEREVVIRTMGEFASLEQIASVVVATREQQPILVRDVGTVQDATQKVRGELWIDGEPAIRLRIHKQAGANTVQVADAMRRELVRLNTEFAGRAKLTVLWDSSDFIRSTISNVQAAGGIGALLAAFALLVFLRSIRATLVVALAIPLSILATFGLMYFRGMTLNVISFGGLALGIGMLVDGAIVILENIYRKRDAGLPPVEAAVEGAQEMSGPVIAGTMTTIAVFVPVVFVGGFAGVFFGEMALVVTFALLCSLGVAMTLVPMLAGRLLARRTTARRSLATSALGVAIGKVLSALDAIYGRVLRSVLVAPWAIVVGAIALLVASVVLVPRVGVELIPPSDEGQIDVIVELPIGTPLETTGTVMQDLERRIVSSLRPNELSHVMTSAGPEAWWRPGGSHEGRVSLVLVPVRERQRAIAAVEADVRKAVQGTPGAKIQVRQGTSNILARIVRGGDDRLAVEIRGHDLATADALGKQVAGIMEETSGITYARADREIGQLERVVHVDRARAAELGLGSSDVADTVEHYVLGRVATRLRDRGDEFDIRVQLAEADRERLEQLVKLPIVTPSGQRVALESLVSLEERRGPSSISRRDQERTLRVNAGIAGRTLGEVAEDVRARLAAVPTPGGFSVALAGESAEQAGTFRALWIGLLLAAFLVYATMAVQFESARHPLVVMASVPFAFVGVMAALLITGTTFNMNSFLGTIVLVGIAVNNAIVLVDTVNRYRRERGTDLVTALVDAGTRRLRPILMTTMTTLLGLLPLALGSAEGSEIQGPLARAVVGGLSSSTLVTLLLVPCVYLLVERRRAT